MRSFVIMALIGAAPAHGLAADGWAAGATGGAGAPPGSVFVVHDRAELLAALDNGGNPTGAKIISVAGTIHGNETADGRLLGEQDYAPGYDITQYMACFVDGVGWSDSAHPWCKPVRGLRTTGSTAEKAQIQIAAPSNTTLRGLGSNIWIDHCTFTDGRHPDGEAPVGFGGRTVQRHDGLLDMEDGTDFVTVSYSRFTDHDKALLIGSGDGRADRDRGHLRITFHHNLFRNTLQRSPRVRFGEVHTYNNLFLGSTRDPDYPMTSEAAAAPEWATMQFTTDVGWDPAGEYSYRPLRSAAAVTATVLREAGAGRVR